MLVELALFSAAISGQPTTRVISSQTFDAHTERRTTAELLERPAGLTDEAFAKAFIEASGLQPWNGELIEFPAAPGRMGGKAVISRSGPEMTFYFLSSDSGTSGRVCRLTRSRGGMTTAWTSAQDWCAARFGLPPLKRPPFVRTVNEPIRE